MFGIIHFWTELITRDINQAKVFIQWRWMYLLHPYINSFENMLHKEKGRSSEYTVLGSCYATCRIWCLCVRLFVKLNQASDASHFNSTELVFSTPRTNFLHFLLYAACANNVIVCHRLALQQIVLFCSYIAFILASKWKWY